MIGGFGKYARWIVTTRNEDGQLQAQFRAETTGDYLRITDDGEVIDAKGNGGKKTWFRVHTQNRGYYKLESVHFEGKYLAVNEDGDDVRVGIGGPYCRLNILCEGPKPEFSLPYMFMRNNTVVIEHIGCAHMRVHPQNGEELQANGGMYVSNSNKKVHVTRYYGTVCACGVASLLFF